MTADMLAYMFISGMFKGMCLYIDVFSGVRYRSMYKTLHINTIKDYLHIDLKFIRCIICVWYFTS